MTTRDPHVAIDRDIVVYPASGDDPKPRICKMTFNEAGANHPRGLYTTAIDLRSTYGSQMRLTRFQVLDVENQPDKHAEGEYMFYYNLSPSLPVNAAMALIVGVNPKRPGWRPIWRGDVVVVKTQEWPDPIKMGAQVIVEEDKRLFGMLRANEEEQMAHSNNNSQCAACYMDEQKVKLRWCSRCHKAKYCSTDCQNIHWNAHKRNCKS